MDYSLRVAIDGAQSTGKTTLWEQLQDRYSCKLVFIPEASRQIAPRFGIRGAPDWPALVSDMLRLGTFFAAEEEWQLNQELCDVGFVSDSSLYLIQAYRLAFGLPVNEVVLKHARYDVLFHCPVANSFRPDGFRFLARREEIDAAYTRIVSERFAGHVVKLPPNNYLDAAVRCIEAAVHERSREA
jgi:nicotinamide riboside kinase